MVSLIRKILKIMGWVLLTFVVIISGFLLFMMLTEYNPDQPFKTEIMGRATETAKAKRDFTLLSWNIGYGGMGAEMDFFYDGGKQVIPEKSYFERCFNGITTFIRERDTVDLFLLQELDVRSKRACFANEPDSVSRVLPGYCHAFAMNYNCRFVPVPLFRPMGYVKGGLATWSRMAPETAIGIPFKTNFPWPERLFSLKRCFLLMRFGLGNGRELVVVNTHNSAFDESGDLRRKEVALLSQYMTQEYARGNFVIAGGDWNSNPQGFDPTLVTSGDKVVKLQVPVDTALFPGWHFIYDPVRPGNRFADMPYIKGETRTTLIDFFIASPNLEIREVKTLDCGFAFTDHEPVVVRIHIPDETLLTHED